MSIHRATERERENRRIKFEGSFVSQKCHIKCVGVSFCVAKGLYALLCLVAEADRLNNLKLAQPVPNTLTFNCYEGRSSQSDQ